MSRTRGEANRALYRARILLESWDHLRAQQTHTELALIGAFLPAVRLHLSDAYGWFLLSVSGTEDSSQTEPPRSVRDLPPPEAGRALTPEIAEFSQLEGSGWLAQVLGDVAEGERASTMQPQSAQGLLVTDRQPLGYAVALAWTDALAAIMNRMDDSLAEC